MNEELQKKIIALGSLNYPVEKCANALELLGDERIQFIENFNNPNSEIYKLYLIGKDVADFEIDSKLLQLSKTGDLKALKELNERNRKRNFS